MVLLMLALFVAVFAMPGLGEFYALSTLAPMDVAIIVLVVAAWVLGLRHIWRARLMQRFLGRDVVA